MRITTGPLTDWVLEFYTALRFEATQNEMGISMRLLSPVGDVYSISRREGPDIEVQYERSPVNPTPTWSAEFDRVMAQATIDWTYRNINGTSDGLQYATPELARFQQLENNFSTPSDEETSCL